MRAFLICPVREHDIHETEEIVRGLELQGWEVHWPPRDTPQTDPIGLEICGANLRAIKVADRIFVVWDGKSQGCLFDLGMAFALGKRITVIEAQKQPLARVSRI